MNAYEAMEQRKLEKQMKEWNKEQVPTTFADPVELPKINTYNL